MAKRQRREAGPDYLMYQQGDVLLFPTGCLTNGMRLAHTVLAQGEATGHAHVAQGVNVILIERHGTLYLVAPQGARIRHEEHAALEVPAGSYRIGRVREYDHFAEEARRIRD